MAYKKESQVEARQRLLEWLYPKGENTTSWAKDENLEKYIDEIYFDMKRYVGSSYRAPEGMVERNLLILKSRFGIGVPVKTFQELSNELNLSRERIRQIEARILRRFIHPVRRHKLKECLSK